MIALLHLIGNIINLYLFLLLVYIALSWLTYFGVVNGRNRVVSAVNDFLYKITEPLLRPLRRLQHKYLPTWQIDLSPILLSLLLIFVNDLIQYDLKRLFLSY
jgi:YggT family protein